MKLNSLALQNFRNFKKLDTPLPQKTVLFVGSNAQGKTSLLEAIYYVATFASFQTSTDRQLVNFQEQANEPAVARIVAEFEREQKKHKLEIRVILETTITGVSRTRKEILLDGVKKSPAEAIGLFNAVLFIPQMFSILEAGPDVRRRYLNLTLAQVLPGYAKTLSKYHQVLTQRNALLKLLSERGGEGSQLDFWNEQFLELGSQLFHWRANAINAIEVFATQSHYTLSDQKETLKLLYRPKLTPKDVPLPASIPQTLSEFKDILRSAITTFRADEIRRGLTLVGPHRDDLRMAANNIDIGDFGSRGQVKTSLLSLKLAEVQWMKNLTGQSPIILLDEVMSEIDSSRRNALMRSLSDYDQALLTTTDADFYSPDFISHSTVWKIDGGQLEK
jgi:DNA replication and repair protein RecF